MPSASIKRIEIYRVKNRNTPERFHKNVIGNPSAPVGLTQGNVITEQPDSVMVRVTIRSGKKLFEGWSEAGPEDPSKTGVSTGIFAEDIEYRLAPSLLEHVFDSTESLLSYLPTLTALRKGMEPSAGVVDTAIFDSWGKINNKPVQTLLLEACGKQKPAGASSESGSQKTSSNEILTLKYDALLPCNGRFQSVAELGNQLHSLSPIPRAVIQPFPPHRYDLQAEFMQKKGQWKNPPLLLADCTDGNLDRIDAVVHTRAYDGILIDMINSGGFSFLCRFISRLFDLKADSWLKVGILPSSAESLASAIYLHGLRFLKNTYSQVIEIIPETSIESVDLNLPGIGKPVNLDDVEVKTLSTSVLYKKDGQVAIRRFPYRSNKPDFRRVQEEIIL